MFIANEANDKLDCESYSQKYNECSNYKLDDILQNFLKNQILSNLIDNIRKGFEEEINYNLNNGKSAEIILGDRIISKIDDSKDSISFEEFENMEITKTDISYNNHLHVREFIKSNEIIFN